MAEELLELYAERSVVQGYAFSEDTPWQRDLEASFPYIETDDQLRVLEAVKNDMEAPLPMDRLVCGDVGYGKTEVALRAAFKAVMDGKQVALLVPTTVLAQQHFHTFRDRLAAFPVEVEMLSRFRAPSRQSNIIYRLAQGAIDIIIGTHRLLSGDVEFKDLGLLVIDEEQRFGVTHKETLKKMRTEVDVLTMTATPIPRTLYMTLTGVRDISTISTPPEERLPIITHVGPYSETIIRRAILRELERGGQIFFVHNRVQTIEAFKNHITRLVPEARIGVAHGQMAENLLSTRMREFTDAKIDILLSTSIIESGLDIPNANTLIVDRADTFGLAQLYQLRGRVGRGAQRAYAYFFKHKKRVPTPEGRQRLETLAENTQLGAGFTIAMRDLEIRGAGDILGARQHGHVATVGFHLYTRLLAEAVKKTRNNRSMPVDKGILSMQAVKPLVSVDLPLNTNIPIDYVPDRTMRLGLYRRLADVQTLDEVENLENEFVDRFGSIPNPVENLFYQMRIKILANQAGFIHISFENRQFILRYPQGETAPKIPPTKLRARTGRTAIWVQMPSGTQDWKPSLLDLLIKFSMS
jgi:transcription-repair coupling factor (superfamily II helicase)